MIIFLTNYPVHAVHIDLREMYGDNLILNTSTYGMINKHDERPEFGKFAIVNERQMDRGNLLGYEIHNPDEPNHLITIGRVSMKNVHLATQLLRL